jgi:hypothetical protein
MMGDVTRLDKTGQLPALGRGDFSFAMRVSGSMSLLTCDPWKIFCEEDPVVAGHLNALLAPNCDFHTFDEVMPGSHVALVRSGNRIHWYVDGVLDNQDSGLAHLDLTAGTYDCDADDAVLFEYGLTPQEVSRLYRGIKL